MQNPLSHFKLQIQDIDWRSLLPNAFLMMCCWSYVPFAYAIQIKTTVFSHDLYSLFAYQICIALAATIIFDPQIADWWPARPLRVRFQLWQMCRSPLEQDLISRPSIMWL